MVQKQQIIIRHREGDSNRSIAQELGIDKNTVNRYVNEYEEGVRRLLTENPDADPRELPPDIMERPRYSTDSRTKSERILAALPTIKECLEENAKKREDGRSKQQMRKIEIYDYLKALGHQISYSTVRRLISEIEVKSKEAYIKQEYQPGEQTEFDWGEVKLDIGNTGYKKYQIAVFCSAYGNYRFARLYRTQDTAAFQESHADYFEFCKGVYHTVVYDNMKVAVKQFVGPSEKEPTDALLELSLYYGFRFRFCNVRSGNEKGHVERSVDVVRHKAFTRPGEDKFDTLEAANRHLMEKVMQMNREDLSDHRIPDNTFEEERPHLMSARPKMPCFIKKMGLRVDKYSTVVVNSVHYSVPDSFVGKRLDAHVYTNKVCIYADGKEIAKHSRHYTPGEYVLDIFHYLRTLKRKPGALRQSSALMQADALIKEIYETYYTTEPKEFLLLLDIINEIGPNAVYEVLRYLSKQMTVDFSAEKVLFVYTTSVDISQSHTDNETTAPYKQDRLSEKSKQTLRQYDMLRMIQGEVVSV